MTGPIPTIAPISGAFLRLDFQFEGFRNHIFAFQEQCAGIWYGTSNFYYVYPESIPWHLHSHSTFFRWGCTSRVFPPQASSPQADTDPSLRRAANALWVAWIWVTLRNALEGSMIDIKYVYIYIYIRPRVKIAYGTFRGVPDVWNEGAS